MFLHSIRGAGSHTRTVCAAQLWSQRYTACTNPFGILSDNYSKLDFFFFSKVVSFQAKSILQWTLGIVSIQ